MKEKDSKSREVSNKFQYFLDEFAESSQTITSKDILYTFDSYYKQRKFYNLISSDERFIELGRKDYSDSIQFLPIKVLIRRLIFLNIRVFNLGLYRIEAEWFLRNISSLFIIPLNSEDKKNILKCIKKYLLASQEENKLVFPIADLLGNIYKGCGNELAAFFIKIIGYAPKYYKLRKIVNSYAREIIGNISTHDRTEEIIIMRSGLINGEIHTLEESGNKFNITRERVRQIEKKFWDILFARKKVFLNNRRGNNTYLHEHTNATDALIISIINYFLSIIIGYRGRRVYLSSESLAVSQFKFIALILDIDFIKSYKLNTYFLEIDKKIISKIEFIACNTKLFKLEDVIREVKKVEDLNLTIKDTNFLASAILKKISRRMKIQDIVYIALKDINKPAHYTEIAKTCNRLFSESYFTPYNIHAVLSRLNDRLPWVWIGSRGIYALKEWGYKRPEKRLYDRVYEIIQKEYLKKGDPVSLNRIFAEVSKYRKIVNRNSLTIICFTHPNIISVSKDTFIISKGNSKMEKKKEDYKNLDFLDEKLKSFNKAVINKYK